MLAVDMIMRRVKDGCPARGKSDQEGGCKQLLSDPGCFPLHSQAII